MGSEIVDIHEMRCFGTKGVQVSTKNIKVFPCELRTSIRQGMLDAVAGSSVLDIAPSADEADLLVMDGCAHDEDRTPASLPEVPLVVLSVLAAAHAPAGSFPAEIARREAAAIESADRWCVLRCAAFGEELAWTIRYETAGALYTAWQPDGAPWVSAADVVELIEKLATQDRWNAAYDVTGPAPVSMQEVCDLLYGLHERQLPYVRLDEDALSSAMEQVGFDPEYAARRASYMVWTTSERCRIVSPVLEQALGRPPTPLAEYLVAAARSSLAAAR